MVLKRHLFDNIYEKRKKTRKINLTLTYDSRQFMSERESATTNVDSPRKERLYKYNYNDNNNNTNILNTL